MFYRYSLRKNEEGTEYYYPFDLSNMSSLLYTDTHVYFTSEFPVAEAESISAEEYNSALSSGDTIEHPYPLKTDVQILQEQVSDLQNSIAELSMLLIMSQ